MESTEFKNIINDFLSFYGFKRRGNFWRLRTSELEKVIHLQKSNFSNLYYINYGFNIENLMDPGVAMHIFNRLHANNPNIQEKVVKTLDLESDLSSTKRRENLIYILQEFLLKEINNINTEDDLKKNLLSKSILNDIPLSVKNHFKLDSNKN